jgi:ATP-dependent helicase HrpB
VKRAPLPIDEAIPALRKALADRGRAVLQAPPGAGKTTAVPLAIHAESWAQAGRIVMLEPRRLAARAAARRMAAMNGDQVGGLVGFRVRGEAIVGPATRIEVVTEGVLTRMLTRDPTLEGVAAVIFDEFHERSLVADTGLALALRTAELVRPELRIVVMSATLDGEAVSRLLGDAPVITAHGRAFPVDVRWSPARAGMRPADAIPGVIRKAVQEHEGDVLVFLPGAAEIRRVGDALAGTWSLGGPRVIALHGSMAASEQDAAITPSAPGERKVVLATSIAETSLTIEGVRVVVDSGLARVPRFDIRSGMTRLETVRVSRDAAEQRRGRAGRVAPGVCYRLWSEGEDASLMARRTPEVLSADLAPLALDLAVAGAKAEELRWLDPPPPAALSQAHALLVDLDAFSSDATATEHGIRMSALGLHPRLAHLVLRGAERGQLVLSCEIAALLAERDFFRAQGEASDPDLALRIAVLRGDEKHDPTSVDRARLMRVRDEARRIAGRVGELGIVTGDGASSARRTATAIEAADRDATAAELLALAYPDRVALAAGGRGRFRMRNGRGATINVSASLASAPALAIADTDGARDDARVYLAAALDREAIERLFGHQAVETTETALDEARGTVLTTRRRSLGALALAEHTERATDLESIATAFASRVRRDGVAAIPWSDAARRARERIAFLHRLDSAWPDVSDAALAASLDMWLMPVVGELRRWSDFERADLGGALLRMVDPKRRRDFDTLAPTHIEVATGSMIPVDYSDPGAPTLSVRMQELFGTAESPRVGGGRVPIVLHLLSPAGRPLQVTRDLGGFWAGSYAEVRKEMRGRYPRHEWPEDPRNAAATRRAKQNKQRTR